MRDANTSLTRSVAIIIPIFNEEDSIESTLTRIFRVTQNIAGWQIKVICVNDGSTDKSALKIQAFPHVTPINHSTNQGYGAALKTGIDASKEGWVCILDADGTYPIENLNHFFNIHFFYKKINNNWRISFNVIKALKRPSPFFRIEFKLFLYLSFCINNSLACLKFCK